MHSRFSIRAALIGLTLLGVACSSQDFETSEPIRTLPVPLKEAASEAGLDWHQWRGPARDGKSRETGLIRGWGEAGPPELWRKPIGVGYSGMVVAGGVLYTMAQEDEEYVLALDALSGREVWRFRSDGPYQDGQGDGPRGCPVVDDGVVYSVGSKGMFHALDAATGRPLWSHDLTKDLGGARPTWGYSTSPLVRGNLVFVEPGGSAGKSLAAFDKKTGRLIWAGYDDPAGYSSPISATLAGQPQIVFFTGRHLVGVVPETGRLLWEVPWRTSYDVNAATPIVVEPDRLFISTNYDVGAALVQVQDAGDRLTAKTVWQNRVMRNHFNSSILEEGYLYGFDNASLKSVEASTGEMKWIQRGFGRGSLIIADGMLIILGERGELALAEATAEAYRELARAQVLKGKCWTSPSLSHGKLYLRNQSEIVCLDVGQ